MHGSPPHRPRGRRQDLAKQVLESSVSVWGGAFLTKAQYFEFQAFGNLGFVVYRLLRILGFGVDRDTASFNPKGTDEAPRSETSRTMYRFTCGNALKVRKEWILL